MDPLNNTITSMEPDMSIKHPAKNGGKWIQPHKRLAIYMRDEFTCQHCMTNLKELPEGSKLRPELDHIVCVSAGGSNHETNLVTACRKCNASRGAKTLEQFHQTERGIERIKEQAQKPLNTRLAKQIYDQMREDGNA